VKGVRLSRKNGGPGINPENFGNTIGQIVHFGEYVFNWSTKWATSALLNTDVEGTLSQLVGFRVGLRSGRKGMVLRRSEGALSLLQTDRRRWFSVYASSCTTR